MNAQTKKARRLSGLARFERTNKRMTAFGGRMMLAWRVPGTRENGEWSNLVRRSQDILKTMQY